MKYGAKNKSKKLFAGNENGGNERKFYKKKGIKFSKLIKNRKIDKCE